MSHLAAPSVASGIPDPPSYPVVQFAPARRWSLEPVTSNSDTLSEMIPISRKVNAQGDQIVEIEIDHHGNIEYPINLPVRQINHSDLLNVSNEHNYAVMLSHLQDDGWGTPHVVPPRIGGSPFQSWTLRKTLVRNK